MKDMTSLRQFEQVLNSTNPVFVDFWAEWYGPFRAVFPVLEKLSGEYKDKVNFVKVNVDQINENALRYNIFSVPTLAIFESGEAISQTVGSFTKDKIRSYIDSNVN